MDLLILVVKKLKHLFLDLIKSDCMAITPEKMFAQIILNDVKGTLFGEQQDIHETMDNIVDMIQVLLKMQKKGSLSDEGENTRLFFGTTRQTLRYVDPDGVEKVLTKEEDFHQIIVDVQPCLYNTIDQYFASQMV